MLRRAGNIAIRRECERTGSGARVLAVRGQPTDEETRREDEVRDG